MPTNPSDFASARSTRPRAARRAPPGNTVRVNSRVGIEVSLRLLVLAGFAHILGKGMRAQWLTFAGYAHLHGKRPRNPRFGAAFRKRKRLVRHNEEEGFGSTALNVSFLLLVTHESSIPNWTGYLSRKGFAW